MWSPWRGWRDRRDLLLSLSSGSASVADLLRFVVAFRAVARVPGDDGW